MSLIHGFMNFILFKRPTFISEGRESKKMSECEGMNEKSSERVQLSKKTNQTFKSEKWWIEDKSKIDDLQICRLKDKIILSLLFEVNGKKTRAYS